MENKSLKQLIKKNYIETLSLIFKDKKTSQEIEDFVDLIIKRDFKNRKIVMRNIYQNIDNFEVEADNILRIICDNGYTITGNGSIMDNIDVNESPTSALLTKGIARRAESKKKENEAVGKGDTALAKYFYNIQNKEKADANSMYGVSCTKGGILYSPDSASAITGQAQQMISEMMWSIERFVAGNLVFDSIDELMIYIKNICDFKISDEYLLFLDHTPTVDECLAKFNKMSENTASFRANSMGINYVFTDMIKNMDENERTRFYYVNNYLEFIDKNIKVKQLLKDIVEADIDFRNPYKIIPDNIEASQLPKYENFKDNLLKFNSIIKHFTMFNMSVNNRIEKYKTKDRKAVLISDTDSVMVSINSWIKFVKEKICEFDKYDEKMIFKLINANCLLITDLCADACVNLAKSSNVVERQFGLLNMKNEFLFTTMMIFSNAKKNYSAFCRLKEGVEVPIKNAIANTGLILNATKNNPKIIEMIENIKNNEILMKGYGEDIDRIAILKEVNKIKDYIVDSVDKGDKAIGIRASYKDYRGYDQPTQRPHIRGSILWNALYPEFTIPPGEHVYAFKTSLRSVSDIMKIDDVEIRNKILDLVFDHENKYEFDNSFDRKIMREIASKFGFSVFCVSSDDDVESIPSWIKPFIDVDDLIDKHMQPLRSILPAVGISNSQATSKATGSERISTIISF